LTDDELETSDPSRLEQILAARGAERWRPQEMGAILRHQLSVPLDMDLAAGSGSPMWRMTFGELLHHPHPPAEMLQRVKQFAKACKLARDGPLPPEVAAVLYFASIIASRLRCEQRISDLDDDALKRGMEWVRAQRWVDPLTRSIFDEAAAKWAATA
jgi:hypothetical protein